MSGKLEGDLSVACLKEQVPLIGPTHPALKERGKSSFPELRTLRSTSASKTFRWPRKTISFSWVFRSEVGGGKLKINNPGQTQGALNGSVQTACSFRAPKSGLKCSILLEQLLFPQHPPEPMPTVWFTTCRGTSGIHLEGPPHPVLSQERIYADSIWA